MKKSILTTIVIALFLSVACERYVDERNPVIETPETGPTPTNLQTYVNDGAVKLTWTMNNSAGVAQYRVYRSDSLGAEAELTDSSTTTEVTLTGLPLNRTHWLQVAAVLSSGLEAPLSGAVPVVPSHLSLQINSGAEYTSDTRVSVEINAHRGATDVLLSENADLTGAVWQDYRTAVSYRLSDGDGAKTIYGLVRFADGSRSGDTLSDDIILDTKASISEVSISPANTVFGAGDTVTFSMQTGETAGEAEVTFPGVSAVKLSDDGLAPDGTADDGTYTGRWVVPLVFHVNSGTVRAVFVDAAGNEADEFVADQRLSVHTVPLAPVLRAVATGPDEVYLTWDDAGNEGLAAWRIHRSDQAQVTTADTVVAVLTATGITNYSDTALQASTTYYYRVYAVYDETTMTGSNTVSATTLSGGATAGRQRSEPAGR
jgi:hypothetical protein